MNMKYLLLVCVAVFAYAAEAKPVKPQSEIIKDRAKLEMLASSSGKKSTFVKSGEKKSEGAKQ